MDSDRLDALSRALSARGSRRRALGGMLAGALAFLSGQDAAAKNCNKIKDKRNRRLCRKRAKEGGSSCTGQCCIDAANMLAAAGTDYCNFQYQFDPARIPACIAAYNSCLPYTRACNTLAGQQCYAAFHAVW
jgi:hypothetical protein